MKAIEIFRANGTLVAYQDYRYGSIYEPVQSIAPTVLNSPGWLKTIPAGNGLNSPGVATQNALRLGNPAALQLTNLTVVTAFVPIFGAGSYRGMVAKSGAYTLYLSSGDLYGIWDYGGAAFRSSGVTPPLNRASWFAASIQSGVANGTNLYVDGTLRAAVTVTMSSNANPIEVGSSTASENSRGSLLFAYWFNRVLTPFELSWLYTDWRGETVLPAPPRKFFSCFPYRQTAEYAAAGIVHSTDYRRLAGYTSTLRDLTGSYTGAVTGVALAQEENQGILQPNTTDAVSWGDVTQLNSAAAFSWEMECDFRPVASIPSSYAGMKYANANSNVMIGPAGGAAVAKSWYLAVGTGAGGASARTQAPQYVRAGTQQHVLSVFNGNGLDNPTRGQIYVDGEPGSLVFAGNLPAATQNLAGVALVNGYIAGINNAAPFGFRLQQLYNRAIGVTEARSIYLANFAQQLDWQYSGEAARVTLAASTADLEGWYPISGTWKISEDATGKRWLECVTTGGVLLPVPSTGPLGTTIFTLLRPSANAAGYVAFYNLARTQGYLLQFANLATRNVEFRSDAGLLWNTGANYLVDATEYSFACVRKPSDGRFTWCIKGGSYADWTLISTAAGSGNNPVVDATRWSFDIMYVYLSAGGKLLIYDQGT